MATLRIADELTLPLDAVTSTFGFIGVRGSGKTHATSVFVEELLGAGMHVVVIDPLDAWWGLRSSADGKSAGLPIVIAGGEHGDIPLEATAGSVLADVVVDERLPLVLSLRHLSKTKQRQFVAEFCERLYHRKGESRHREPLHVAIDEADAFIPQRVAGDTARVMGAVDDLVRRGRSSGFGVSLITQRPAVIHKDVLTQIDTLVAFRVVSPQDRRALESWVEAHDAHGQREAFLSSLASLPVGTAWFWSPGFLDIFQQVKVRGRRTFDSSATPKVGQRALAPKVLADVDLDALRERIAATIERVAADDPKLLKRRITQLERELARLPTATAVERVVERVEVPVIDERVVARLVVLLSNLSSTMTGLTDLAEELSTSQGQIKAIMGQTARTPSRAPRPVAGERPKPPVVVNADDISLRAGERKMLMTLAGYYPRLVTRAQFGTLSGYTSTGGTFRTYFGNLHRNGLIEQTPDGVRMTEAGMNYLGAEIPSAPQTTEELLNLWRGALRAGERKMLDELVEVYPDPLSRDELGDLTGFAVSGGTFRTYLGVLRRNGLIEVAGDEVRAADALFIGAGR